MKDKKRETLDALKAEAKELWQWLLTTSIPEVGLIRYREVKALYYARKRAIHEIEKELILIEDGHINS